MTAADVSVDRRRFSERWRAVRSFESGNQGLAYEAVDEAGVRAFIKEFKPDDNDAKERRARFCREVRILGRLDVPGIARLIESNAEHFADEGYELYFAAEYVDGETFANAVFAGLQPIAATDIVLQVSVIVARAHAVGVVHRDIKPDNVMVVRSESSFVTHVVDFGMAYEGDIEFDFRTHRGQETGNRFLRLPEHSAGSEHKRDPRSDITFCVGLLFFALAKAAPRFLLDHENRLPHQRPWVRGALAQTGLDLSRLLAIFDVGFANDIDKRYQNFEAFVTDLRNLAATKAVERKTDAGQRLRGRYANAGRLAEREVLRETRGLVGRVSVILHDIVRDFGDLLKIDMANHVEFDDGASCDYGVTDSQDRFRRFSVHIVTRTIGAEHVMTATSGAGTEFTLRYVVGTTPSEAALTQLRRFFEDGIDVATADERFTSPRPLEPSPYHPFVGGQDAPGWRMDDEETAEEEASFEYRPMIVVAWYRPHMRAGVPFIAWSLRNAGAGTAKDVRFSFPYMALEAVPEIARGQTVSFERRFDRTAAYHDIMKGTVLGFVEFDDRDGRLYRQSLVVHGAPARLDWQSDYYTTQFGYPFLAKAGQRMVQPPTDGGTAHYREHSMLDGFYD